jgi:peptide chain release factor subunit 3
MLVNTAGVLINKMGDSTVNWDQARYDEIHDKLIPYLKKCGFKSGEDIVFMRCNGMSVAIFKEHHPGEQVFKDRDANK